MNFRLPTEGRRRGKRVLGLMGFKFRPTKKFTHKKNLPRGESANTALVAQKGQKKTG